MDSLIAANRFGLGLRADEKPPANPKAWLLDQLDRFDPAPQALSALVPERQVIVELIEYRNEIRPQIRAERREAAQNKPDMPMDADPDGVGKQRRINEYAQRFRSYYRDQVAARVAAACATETPFAERLVHFWANHFAVSADKQQVVGITGMLEFNAIRPNLTGNFLDLVLAVERHPAMMFYLDQATSIGPNSPLASLPRVRGRLGLNENLAREIMELHTLGVRTGYSQADVTEFARAMTGWTIAGFGRGAIGRALGLDGEPGQFVFAPQLHEPGTRTVMGKSYRDDGEGQARAIIADLCRHPATATHIATKLARHFMGDSPPQDSIARIAAAFTKSGGELKPVYAALINEQAAWAPTSAKFKNPWDWGISAMRGLGARQLQPRATFQIFNQLGQPVWQPKSPAGWDDTNAAWAAPDALMRRAELSERLASLAAQPLDARAIAPQILGPLSDHSRDAIARAGDPAQALALMVMTPEFLRR